MTVSLTIDNLSPEVLSRLNEEARRRGVEVNVIVREILEARLGCLKKGPPSGVNHDLDELAGTWSAEETDAFLKATAEMRRVDEDLWR